MISSRDHPETMVLAGYLAVADHGFALPVYQEYGVKGNAWYTAEAAIPGDHLSPIATFEVIEDGVDHHLPRHAAVRAGDPWQDVFLWDGAALTGTPPSIFRQIEPSLSDVLAHAPLSLLDLALAADNRVSVEASAAARDLLCGRLGLSQGPVVFREMVVRSGVQLELFRCLYRAGLSGTQDWNLEFRLDETGTGRYRVGLEQPGSAFGQAARLEEFRNGMAHFAEAIGVSIELGALQVPAAGQGAELPAVPEPAAEPPVLAPPSRSRPRRSRFLGFSREIAIDFGSSRTRVLSHRSQTLHSEPSLVAVERRNGKVHVIAVGDQARLMKDRTSGNVKVIQPLRDGAIADLDLAVELLKYFMAQVRAGTALRRPLDVVLTVPASATKAELRAMRTALQKAGASDVKFLFSSLAAAIGAGLPVNSPTASMIVLIGSGVTQIAIVAFRGIAYETSVRIGGEAMTEAIVSHYRRTRNLRISATTAERIKVQFGMAGPPDDGMGRTFTLRGKDLSNGIPKEITGYQSELATAVADQVNTIVEALRIALENLAPALAEDIVDQGMVIAGGSAALAGLRDRLAEETGLPVEIADDPANCSLRGLSRVLDDPLLYGVLIPA